MKINFRLLRQCSITAKPDVQGASGFADNKSYKKGV